MFRNMCRLCLGTDDLIWIFSDKMVENMQEIISITSGVEITRNDTVTQMVCTTCCQVTIKMYQFRTKSIKNDKDLKARCAGYNIAQLTNTAISLSPPSVSIPQPVSNVPTVIKVPFSVPAAPVSRTPTPMPTLPPPLPRKYQFAHPSVKEVFKKNPKIILPDECLKSHVGAYITIMPEEVDDYFRSLDMTDADIEKVKKEALEYAYRNEIVSVNDRKRSSVDENSIAPSTNKKAKLSTETKELPKDKGIDWPFLKTALVGTPNEIKLGQVILKGPEKKLNQEVTRNDQRTPDQEIAKRRPEQEVAKNKADYDMTRNKNRKVSQQSEINKPEEVAKRKETSQELVQNLPKLPQVSLKDKLAFTLNSMLNTTSEKKDNNREAITLTSLLQDPTSNTSLQKPPPTSEVIEIFDDVTANNNNSNIPIPVEDFEWFTSRPFLKETSACTNNSLSSSNQTRGTLEPQFDQNSSSSDPIIFDIDSRSSTESDTEKTSFAKALHLAPTSTDSNMPDLSLVALAPKTRTLYTCRVCDSQHNSQKELKQHEKRTHTKCPFCSKRFRTLALRDEHVSSTCSINKTPIPLKNPKLELKRVDEDPQIRVKYTSAFEQVDVQVEINESQVSSPQRNSEVTPQFIQEVTPQVIQEETPQIIQEVTPQVIPEVRPQIIQEVRPQVIQEVTPQEVGKSVNKSANKSVTKTINKSVSKNSNKNANKGGAGRCNSAIADAINELEQFLNYAENVSGKKQNADLAMAQKSSKFADVICISDEETDAPNNGGTDALNKEQTNAPDKEPTNDSNKEQMDAPNKEQIVEEKINVVNSEVLKNINLHDTELNVLKSILSQTPRKNGEPIQAWNLQSSPIVDGNTPRVKIFKNLRKYLHQYKIPIEVKYSANVSVQYKPVTAPAQKKTSGLWYNQKPIDLVPSPNKYTILNSQIGLPVVPNTPRQNVIPTTNNPIVPSSNYYISQPVTVSSSSSIRLNNTQNFVILSNTLLPSTQGPLPVIESVMSAPLIEQPSTTTVAQLESITNSLMPKSDSDENNGFQPSIRVKNLKDLS